MSRFEDDIIFEADIEEVDEYERIKAEAEAKAKRAILKRQAEAEVAEEYGQEDLTIFETDGVESKAQGKRNYGAQGMNERNAMLKTAGLLDKIQQQVENELIRALDSDAVEEEHIDASRNEEVENRFGVRYDLRKTILEDVYDNETGKRWQNDPDMINIFDYMLYVFGQNHITKEIYKTRTKNGIRHILMTAENIADYRHTFREETYESLMKFIPKYVLDKYSEEYLRETFILLNIIYKYGENATSVGLNDLVDIILEKNDILPATVKYGIPYTKEFLLDLSKFKIFSAIQNMCVEEAAMEQAVTLSAMIDEKLAIGKDTGELKAADLKSLADTLGKLNSILEKHKVTADENRDSLVYRVPEKGLDYSKFVYIEPYKTVGKPKDRNYKYYITVFKSKKNGEKEFLGYYDVAKNISFESMKIFTDPKEVAKVNRELNITGEYVVTVMRMDVNDFDIRLAEEVSSEDLDA